MKMQKFSDKTNYSGKWCLYREHQWDGEFNSIYVFSIKDGIVKHCREYAQDDIRYVDVEKFQDCYNFFVNPFQIKAPLEPGVSDED